VALGVLVGVAGVVLLFWNVQLAEGQAFDRSAALILICGSLCWSLGSVWSRSIGLPSSPLMATAMEMLCGGVALLIGGLVMGETSRVNFANISLRSVLSLLYLIVFGSLIAFSSYVWLLKVSTPAKVATYAFVNPVVAVLLGVTLGGEPFGAKTLIASAIILSGVILITLTRRSPRVDDSKPLVERDRDVSEEFADPRAVIRSAVPEVLRAARPDAPARLQKCGS